MLIGEKKETELLWNSLFIRIRELRVYPMKLLLTTSMAPDVKILILISLG